MILVSLTKIQPNPWQTRQVYPEPVEEHPGTAEPQLGPLAGLAADNILSLSKDILSRKTALPDTLGLLQLPAGRVIQKDGHPLTRSLYALRGDANKYLDQFGYTIQLAYGHNRLAAFRLLSQTDPAYNNLPLEVVLLTDEQMATAAWAENAQRQDLSPIEEAEAIHRMMDSFGWSQTKIAGELHLSRPAVSNKLRLLRLEDDARQAVLTGAITERQALAILPALDLPEAAIQSLGQWDKPAELLKRAQKGDSSDDLRERADRIIHNATRPLDLWPPDHPFPGLPNPHGEPVEPPTCTTCPLLLRHKDALRCPDPACHDAKRAAWTAARLAEASAALNIPPIATGAYGGPDEPLDYNNHDTIYSSVAGAALLKDGCKKGNLRLVLERHGYHPEGFPDVSLICYHHKSKRCTCQSSDRAESQWEIEQRELKKQIREQITQPLTAIVETALAENHLGVWRDLLGAVSSGYKGKSEKWDLDQIRHKIATHLIENWCGYNYTLDAARDAAAKKLTALDLPCPWQVDPLLDLRVRLDRVAGWVSELKETIPTEKAVMGNLDNLEKLAVELLTCETAQPELKSIAAEEISRLEDVLRAILPIIPTWDIVEDNAQWQQHGSWLVTVPSGDINFKSALEDVTRPNVIRYAGALVQMHEGTKTKQAALDRRLRQIIQNLPEESVTL